MSYDTTKSIGHVKPVKDYVIDGIDNDEQCPVCGKDLIDDYTLSYVVNEFGRDVDIYPLRPWNGKRANAFDPFCLTCRTVLTDFDEVVL